MCKRVFITFSLLATIALFAENGAPANSGQSEQAAKLQRAEQLADSAVNRLHKTLDFEPILSDSLAPDVIEAWRKKLPKSIESRDVIRVFAAGLSVLYLTPLLEASLKMNGVNVESDAVLPPDVKTAMESLDQAAVATEQIFSDRLSSETPEQLQELIEKAQNARLTMLKSLRPDVWTSAAYKKFLESYPDESRIESDSDSDVKAIESETGGKVKGPVYSVRREGLVFMVVEDAGVMKIFAVTPAWVD